jgi:hypothetical protein
MTLKEIRERMMRAAGIEAVAEDKFFMLYWLDIINEAQEHVSRETKAPTRYVYINNFSGSTLPYPGDMWEDGLLAVKWNYRNSPVLLEITNIRNLERKTPNWTSTDFTAAQPYAILYDPPEAKLQLKLIPTPTQPGDYALYYHARPLPMLYDSHEPLSVMDDDGVTRLSTMANAHEMVAIRAAYLYCRKQMYRRDVPKDTVDGYAARAKLLDAEYNSKRGETFNQQAGGLIEVRNAFYDPEVV